MRRYYSKPKSICFKERFEQAQLVVCKLKCTCPIVAFEQLSSNITTQTFCAQVYCGGVFDPLVGVLAARLSDEVREASGVSNCCASNNDFVVIRSLDAVCIHAVTDFAW